MTESISRLEELYRWLISADVTTKQEMAAKAEIISLLPQVKAAIHSEDSPEAREMAEKFEKLYDHISKWNPLTAWFRDDEVIGQLFFELLSKVRLMLIRRQGSSSDQSALVSESLESMRQSIAQLSARVEGIQGVMNILREIVSPTDEQWALYKRIVGFSSRARDLERRIAEFEASDAPKTEADKARIAKWKEAFQKLSKQIAALRKLTQKTR
jgi:DNA repair exonuclease SbcCD ATPase subunit